MPTTEYTDAADWLQANKVLLADAQAGYYSASYTETEQQLARIAALLRMVGPLVEEQAARIAAIEAEVAELKRTNVAES